MSVAHERLEFAPPRTPGLIRALILAVLAHGALVAALTAGVAWKRESPPVTVEAELWSAVPQPAAPPAPSEPPPVVPTPVTPPTTPEPPKPAPEPPKPVAAPDPAIAIAREKALQKQKMEQEKQRQEKAEVEKLKKEKEKLVAQLQKAKEAQEKAEAKKIEEQRQQNLNRIAKLAGGGSTGGNGDTSSASSAAQASGPSATYIGRINARIKPNITYAETIVGNPTTEIEVRTSPDGTIIGSKIVKSSGTKSWDNAALKAIEKTGRLPFDENGRVPTPMVVVLSPQELIGN
jgi:colicin import membrane protein